jgi:hypothetical protein
VAWLEKRGPAERGTPPAGLLAAANGTALAGEIVTAWWKAIGMLAESAGN